MVGATGGKDLWAFASDPRFISLTLTGFLATFTLHTCILLIFSFFQIDCGYGKNAALNESMAVRCAFGI